MQYRQVYADFCKSPTEIFGKSGQAWTCNGLLRRKTLPALQILGKLAMADVFLVALYITLTKGIGVGRIETAWGLYLFTACILASIAIGHFTEKGATRAGTNTHSRAVPEE